jgi:hypothetical protein
MKLQNMPRMDEADIEDVRDKKIQSIDPNEKGDIEFPDKRLIEEPEGDIGYEMQKAMPRGYGKARRSNQWRVR